jgi:hypothetical protein
VTSTPALDVTRCWDGRPVPVDHHARFELELTDDALCLKLDAPWFDDPLPAALPGSVERLWEYEVAELFIAGAGDDDSVAYLELELGPGGHYLVLQLDGVRRVRRSGLPIEYRVLERVPGSPDGPGRYRAEVRVPREYLPATACRANAYLIHGVGDARCYHAHAPVPGAAPDFHQPARFVPIVL